ncbi:MAG: lysine-sensitive aspartokinase 3 [Spirochaetes bacterium]|nr:lysine-sensitive aspartokinase 3 [Spirochaetota bacterium]
MIVLKFGGTSVKDSYWIDRTIDITNNQIERAPVLVSSAISKVTDKLISIGKSAEENNKNAIFETIETLKKMHFDVAKDFLTGKNLETATEALNGFFQELESFSKGLFMLKECSPKSLDMLVSFGERLSTLLIYHRTIERKIDSELIDARKFIITDDNFKAASPNYDLTNPKIKEYIKPKKGKIIITQGFIASTPEGVTTTLGRGGSDFSATIIGSALDAEEVQIWTDVDGILTTDPRVVPQAKKLETISYSEAAELAFFGAKVVHPYTIYPAVVKHIPVIVKNTKNPDCTGTSIIKQPVEKGIIGIAGKKNLTSINISSYRMLNAYGFLSRIFTVFNKYKTPVDLISTSEVSVSMTIEDTANIDLIEKELEEIGKVTIESNNGTICLVGKNIWKDSSLISKIFETIYPTSVKMISLGASDVNLSMVLNDDEIDDAIIKLHKVFFE